ncbi:MAG: sec-independent translocase [Propionibacteriaceae bacterium]
MPLMDINAGEFIVLIVLALVIFGPEKLPDLARKAARIFHFLRGIANNAQDKVREQLGPEFADLDLRHLDPKTFVRDTLLGDDFSAISDEVVDLRSAVQQATATVREDIAEITPSQTKAVTPGFDDEAT